MIYGIHRQKRIIHRYISAANLLNGVIGISNTIFSQKSLKSSLDEDHASHLIIDQKFMSENC